MAYVKLTDSNESLNNSEERISLHESPHEEVQSRPQNGQTLDKQRTTSSLDNVDSILREPPERITVVRKKHIKQQIYKKLNGAEAVLIIIALIILFANMATRGYLNGIMLLIQHTLNIKDAEVIFTDIMFDLGIVIGVIPGVLVRTKMNRPKTLAVSTVALALGCFMCAGPYFWYSRHHNEYAQPSSVSLTDYDICGTKDSTLPTYMPKPPNSQSSEFFVIFGSGMMGIGASLMFVVGLPYTADAFGGRRTPLVTGILLVAGVAGVWLGELFSFLIQLTASGVNYNYDTTSRWWLGFLLFGLVSLLLALVLCTFHDENYPGKEDEEEKKRRNSETWEQVPGDNDGFYYMRLDEERRRNQRCIPFLIKHVNMVFLSLAVSLEGAILTGYILFMPKFYSVVTNDSFPRAEISYASVTLIPMIIGIICCALYIQWVTMESKQLCRMIVMFNAVVICVSMALFVFHCKEPAINGVDGSKDFNTYRSSILNATWDCAGTCNCPSDPLTPVCGNDDVTYLSPCMAGCKTGNSTPVFSNCSCISGKSQAVAGPCAADCPGHGWNMALLFFIFTLVGVQLCASVVVIFKVTTGYQRVCALAFLAVTCRVLGNLPALGYFKFTLDNSCLIWAQTPSGNKYNYNECVIYHSNSHQFFFMSLVMLLKALIFLFNTGAYLTTKANTTGETIADVEAIRFRRLELEDENSTEIEPPPTPI